MGEFAGSRLSLLCLFDGVGRPDHEKAETVSTLEEHRPYLISVLH